MCLKTACDEYLASRTGKYEYRRLRYSAAIQKLISMGLNNEQTVVDVGAGWTEFDYCLRTEYDWRGRYLPLDGGLTGIDLEQWRPNYNYDYFVCLEILEHLHSAEFLVQDMQDTGRGIVVSVPNPRTTDVLGMDETHVRNDLNAQWFERRGFLVTEQSFYGGENDSLLAWWSTA